eukprot:tig00001229_g7851.t1
MLRQAVGGLARRVNGVRHTTSAPDVAVLSGNPAATLKRKAIIYRPTPNPMQQGRGDKTQQWKLRFEPGQRWVNPLMGWTSTNDTLGQTNLFFQSRDAAVSYAERNGLDFTIEDTPQEEEHVIHPYASNFKWKGPPKSEDD